MLEQFIPRLVKELELGDATLASGMPGTYALPLDEGLTINMTEIPNGIIFKSTIAPFPRVQEELFVTQAMLANMFGQGTRGSVLGLTPEGNNLTLTHAVDYPIDYKEFREILEDFINTVDVWREEATTPAK